MGVICFGKTLQKLSLSCQIIHCRSNKMNPDLTCNSSSWSKEEDIAFETALAIYSGDSNQFMKIAAAVPGKSLQEIIEHYNVLVEDINDIESGKVPLPNYERMQSCASRGSRLSGAEVERRKGIAWTAEEHRLFLQGLEKYGRGDWRSISRNCVLSRTPTQVASHAQKFFSRLNDVNKAKRRRSIHDITSVNAADITEPSQGQKSDKLKGPCGGQLQWPIADYVTEAMDTGMSYLSGPVTNCMTDAIEGPSAVNPEKFPVGASLGSELNTSFRDVDEFLLGIEDLITVPAEGTSGAWRGVHTRTSPSLSLQPSVAGGTGMYTHPVNNVGYELEDLMTKQLVGATQVDPIFNTASLPLSIADHNGVHGCADSSSGAKNGFESTVGAPKGGFSVDSLQLPSIPGTSVGGTYPSLNASSKDDNIGLASTVRAPKGGFFVDSMQLPSIPGTSGSGTYPSLNSSSKDDNIGLASTLRAPKGGFFVDSMQLPSIPGTSGGGTYPSLNASSKDDTIGLESTLGAPKGDLYVDYMQLPSIPGTSGGGTYPSLNPSSKEDSIFDLEDLFPDHILGFGK